MRDLVTAERIAEFMRRFGRAAREETRIYLTGGATAVLIGWRASTVDIDLKIVPDRDEMYRSIPALKEALNLNIELASPPDFIPEIPDWGSRSVFIAREGKAQWHHFDFYSQALSKIERGHSRDLLDLQEMLRRGLVEPGKLREYFGQIRSLLYRYPAIDPPSFERRLDSALGPRHP
jgi:hypothetical protein